MVESGAAEGKRMGAWENNMSAHLLASAETVF